MTTINQSNPDNKTGARRDEQLDHLLNFFLPIQDEAELGTQ
jgi:hypothetical protein